MKCIDPTIQLYLAELRIQLTTHIPTDTQTKIAIRLNAQQLTLYPQ